MYFQTVRLFKRKTIEWEKERSAWKALLKDGSGEAGSVQVTHGDAVLKELSSGKDWW